MSEEEAEAEAARLLGEEGEKRAARFLSKRGYKVLLRNVRLGRGELDLICRDGEVLVFVEVKTRSERPCSRPIDAVTQSKRRSIVHAAMLYLRELDFPNIIYRFDIVEVVAQESGSWDINVIQNVFVTGR